tara:strand:- start:3857 stop:4219 length:363 start_codon:yes stop_codon:yes gene_type:complete
LSSAYRGEISRLEDVMLDPRKWTSREDVLSCFNDNPEEFEVVLAMAKVGWAFCQIHAFEGLVQGLLFIASKVRIGKPEHYEALDAGGRMLLKHEKLSRSMLGQMTGHLKKQAYLNVMRST